MLELVKRGPPMVIKTRCTRMNHGGRRILALLIFVLGKHPQFCDNLLLRR